MSEQPIGVDATGGPVFDPTFNVMQLVEASNKRQDDLREANNSLYEEAIRHLKEQGVLRETYTREIGMLRAAHQNELNLKEAGRIDSIRQVDREEVAKTALAANTAIAALANQTSTLAETLRTQVATVALAAENRQAAFSSDVNKRLSALELSSSEGKGKQAVSDPQLVEMLAEIKALRTTGSVVTGKSEGISASWGVLLGAVGLIVTILTIAALLMTRGPSSAVSPQVIYAPAPTVAQPLPK